jgi:hypothetical protein
MYDYPFSKLSEIIISIQSHPVDIFSGTWNCENVNIC